MLPLREKRGLAATSRLLLRLAPCVLPALVACGGSGGADGANEKSKAPVQAAPQSAKEPPTPPRQPRPAPPPFDVATWLNRGPYTLDDLRGSVVVLDFWSTASGTCRRLMPRLQALLWKHRSKGLVLIGVAEDPVAEVREFARSQGIAYPLAVDTHNDQGPDTFDAWGIESIPTVWVLDRYGEVAWHGAGEDLSEELLLEELAREPPPPEGTP
jgi:peroxiredoxin